MQKMTIVIVLFAALFFIHSTAHAFDTEAGGTAKLAIHATKTKQKTIDPRVIQLEAFLRTYNSPMANDAAAFVEQADKYNLDWKLIPAIAGLESTFGKFVPQNSYNPFGWGIPSGANSGIAFTSWEHAIATVSEGIRNRYMNRGLTTIEKIGNVYAASPTWSTRVRYFMNEIDNYEVVDNRLIAMNL
jgi:hypothetical protein